MPDNKAIVKEYLEQVWHKHHLAAIDEYFSPDYVQHTTGVQQAGRDGVRAFFGMVGAAFSNINFVVEDLIGEGDKVVWRFILHAKHTGPFMGLPVTGKTITLTGMSIVRLENGIVMEGWGEQDMLGLMQQLRS